MITKKIFNFLFMPYVPLLKLNFSFKVLFIPELILSLIFTLVVLIFNEIYDWRFSFSLKLMLLLIFQVLFSFLLNNAKPLDKNNIEIYDEFHFDKKMAIISFASSIAIIVILVYVYQLSKSESAGIGI